MMPQLGLMVLLMLTACGRTGQEGPEASGETPRDSSHASAEQRHNLREPAAKEVLGYRGTVAKREVVCVDAADADFTEIRALYASAGWSNQRPGTDPCRYLVHYNEAYNEFPSLKSDAHQVFNTEKCVFDVFTEPDGSIGIMRAAALRGRPAAIKNCAARTLLALEGRSRALTAKDSELTSQTGGSAEAVLSTAVALLNESRDP